MSADLTTGSPLDTAETAFRLLVADPGGMTLNCAGLAPDLPQEPLPLLDLRMLLTSRDVTNDTRDAVWRELVARSRRHGAAWTVAAVGMALPALRQISGALTRDLPACEAEDVDIEVLTGFLDALQRIKLELPGIRPRLCEIARWAGERAVRKLATETGRRLPLKESAAPHRPWGHPDLVLLDAVAQGVLTELDAELVGLTRLESLTLSQAAERLGMSEAAARKRRQRCEPVLVAALRQGEIEPSLSLTITSAPPGGVEETSARSQPIPDAATATDPKGARDNATGSARNHNGRHRHQKRHLIHIAVVAALVIIYVAAEAIGVFAATAAGGPADLNAVFDNLRNWLIGLLAALATLMLTIGGLRYLVAGGDPGEVQKAKTALKAAAFGYALAILAPLFVTALKSVVGG
ncbi:RNA polymerase sigma factor [Nonomuraea sp. NPDC050556]|uniref:RNA polymerase sigma factor n=1 Tax=Nonomuraea sp. NPDC050556 TaxID=3364369 RepID=UPI0037938483